MISEPDCNWVALLQTAKQIRRSVRPVEPSAGFRSHLRSDLATTLEARQRRGTLLSTVQDVLSPGLLLAACLGMAALSLALITWRNRTPSRR